MQKTTELFNRIWRDRDKTEEIRVDIAGVSYYEDSIISVSTSGGVFSKPGIGNCASRQVKLEIYPNGTIPRQAKIEIYLRLHSLSGTSEWIRQGVFFISRRSKNKITETLTIQGFDAMLKAGQVWLTPDYDYDNWPKTETEAVNDIASRMGVKVDTRTVLGNKFKVDYPVDENGDMTMMDILEGIATANVGNWIITEDGNLLLLRFEDLPSETNYLVDEQGAAITMGGVRILVG